MIVISNVKESNQLLPPCKRLGLFMLFTIKFYISALLAKIIA